MLRRPETCRYALQSVDHIFTALEIDDQSIRAEAKRLFGAKFWSNERTVKREEVEAACVLLACEIKGGLPAALHLCWVRCCRGLFAACSPLPNAFALPVADPVPWCVLVAEGAHASALVVFVACVREVTCDCLTLPRGWLVCVLLCFRFPTADRRGSGGHELHQQGSGPEGQEVSVLARACMHAELAMPVRRVCVCSQHAARHATQRHPVCDE